MPATRPSPMSASAIKSHAIVQLGTKGGEKCTVRFGLSDKFDVDKTWRTISVYPPADAIAALKEFDLENDGLTNIVRLDDRDREYVHVKVHQRKTRCRTLDGEKHTLAEISHDDKVIIIVRPESWQYDGSSGIVLRARMVIECDDDDEDFNIL
jgi:hypothetical protein